MITNRLPFRITASTFTISASPEGTKGVSLWLVSPAHSNRRYIHVRYFITGVIHRIYPSLERGAANPTPAHGVR